MKQFERGSSLKSSCSQEAKGVKDMAGGRASGERGGRGGRGQEGKEHH